MLTGGVSIVLAPALGGSVVSVVRNNSRPPRDSISNNQSRVKLIAVVTVYAPHSGYTQRTRVRFRPTLREGRAEIPGLTRRGKLQEGIASTKRILFGEHSLDSRGVLVERTYGKRAWGRVEEDGEKVERDTNYPMDAADSTGGSNNMEKSEPGEGAANGPHSF